MSGPNVEIVTWVLSGTFKMKAISAFFIGGGFNLVLKAI
jgi:hypothetical protein